MSTETTMADQIEQAGPCGNIDEPSICALYERARIVAWLRTMVDGLPEPEEYLCRPLDIAAALEEGKHEL